MTKKQKILFWVGAALFVVPEVLWSPVGNFWYSLIAGGNSGEVMRDNWLMVSDSRNYLVIVVFLQTIGLLISSLNILKSQSKAKYLAATVTLILFIISVIALGILLVFQNASF